VSAQAADKIKDLLALEPQPLFLRVYIQGGGCSGFQYGFEFSEESEQDDLRWNVEGVDVRMDPISHQYLHEATLDYEKSIMGEKFIFRNPNAKSTCGCGSSFSA